jgi:NADPH-dependent curcumin reductase
MGGGAVGIVEASNNPRFKAGDAVVGMGGWQRYSLSDGGALRVVDAKAIPIQAYLGPAGMPGVTAWYGLNRIIAPEKSETVLVSAATGAVGSVVGQLAKLAGARAVGIAGGPEKCAYAVRELGYAACVDHKSLRFPEDLKDSIVQRARRVVRERRRRAVPASAAAAQRFRPDRDLRAHRLL